MGFCWPTVDQALSVAGLAMAARIYCPADEVLDGTCKFAADDEHR
jgi:hypothetical protein